MKTTTTTTKNNYRFFIILALVLFSCALIISSIWDTSNSLTKSAWEFLIFLPSFLLANAGAIIKSNAGRGMIGTLILYALIKIGTQSLKKNKKDKAKATSEPITISAPVEKWQPWLHIPDVKENRKIIRLWCEGKSAADIGKEVLLGVSTIHNIISSLRKQYPKANIPKDTERKKLMNFWLSQ